MRCCWEFLARVLCLVPVCLFACLLVVVGYVKSDVSFRGLRPMMRSLDLRCFVSFRSSFVSIVARCLCVGTCAGWWWCRRTVSIVYRVGYRVGSQRELRSYTVSNGNVIDKELACKACKLKPIGLQLLSCQLPLVPMGLYIVAALPIWFYQPLTGRRVMAFLAYKFLVPMYMDILLHTTCQST